MDNLYITTSTLIYRYDPGDVAVIHPVASFTDVQTFLSLMGWGDISDIPFSIEQNMFGALSPRFLFNNYSLMWSHRSVTSLSSTKNSDVENPLLSFFGFQSGA